MKRHCTSRPRPQSPFCTNYHILLPSLASDIEMAYRTRKPCAFPILVQEEQTYGDALLASPPTEIRVISRLFSFEHTVSSKMMFPFVSKAQTDEYQIVIELPRTS